MGLVQEWSFRFRRKNKTWNSFWNLIDKELQLIETHQERKKYKWGSFIPVVQIYSDESRLGS